MTKRLAAWLLAVVLSISCLYSPMLTLASDNIFSDDFSSENMQGWSSTETGTVSDGYYTSKADSHNLVSAIGEKKNVSVSAKASVSVTKKDNGFKTGSTAYVCARESQDGSYGYEFGIGVSKDGTTFVRLYLRNENAVSKTLYQTTDEIEGVGKIAQGQYYNIKLAVSEQTMYCFINDVLVFETQDATFSSGYVGIKSISGKAQFDDVVIQNVPDKKVEQITVEEHSTEVSRSGKLYFALHVKYNDIFGTEILNQDSEGVTFSGLNGSAGKKTVTVSYQGKTASFSVNVVEKVPQTILYSNDFSGNSLEDWSEGTYKNSKEGFTYNYGIKNGYAYVEAPNFGNRTVSSYACNVTRPMKETSEYGSYSIEVKAAIDSDAKMSVTRYGSAGLLFARDHRSEQRYELRISSLGQIYVYKQGKELFNTTFERALGKEFQYGKYYTLKANVYEGCAQVFINDKSIAYIADFGDPDTDAYLGMRSSYGSVRYDDFKVASIEEKGKHAVQSISVVNTLTGKEIGKKVLYKFDINELIIIAKYIDGTSQPIKITENMLSAYQKESPNLQTITVTYAGKKYPIQYQYKNYLFYDDFEDGIAGGWKISCGDYMEYSVASGRLKIAYDSTEEGEKGTLSGQVKDGEEWTNYSVSADIYLENKGNTNSLTRYSGIWFRVSDNSRYEFRLSLNSAGAMVAHLLRKNDSTTTSLKTYTTNRLSSCLERGEVLSTGNIYNLRVDAVGNTFNIYFNGKRLDTYVDKTNQVIMNGTAGFRTISSNCYYDNFMVQPKEAARITDLELSNAENRNYSVWRGNEIDIWNNSLIVSYSDGTKEEMPLTAKNISAFDCNEVGKHAVTLSYGNFERGITVEVKERPEYVNKFVSQLKKFAKKVKGSNLEAFKELKAYYDTLTPYEVSTLKKNQNKKYEKLLTSYECYIAPELKGEKLILSAGFNGDETGLWGDSYEGNLGIWDETNGLYYEAQQTYGRYGTGWRCPDIYGEITGMSADCLLLSDDMHMGFGINLSSDGYYHIRISTTAEDEFGYPIFQLQFLRRTPEGHERVETLATEAYDHKIEKNQWVNLKMTLIDNTIRVYLDDELLITYVEEKKLFDVGDAGLRISDGDGLYDNVRIYGTKLERPESANKIEPTFYTDDFEDETVGQNPSHWMEERTETTVTDDWKVVHKDDGKVYGTEKKANTITHLYAFDNNPKISVDFMASGLSKGSKVGFVTRMAPETAYVKVLYDNTVQKWCVVYAQSRADGDTVLYQEDTFQMEQGRWYTAEIIESGRTVSLKIDDKEIFSFDSVMHDGYGKVGFCTEAANMYIDNFEVEMSSGDIPQDGAMAYTIKEDVFSASMEIESFDDGTNLLGVAKGFLATSKDSGTTWQEVTEDEKYSQIYWGNYTTLLQMSNGKYLQIVSGEDFAAKISDDLLNWTTVGRVVPLEEQMSPIGSKQAIIHINTATEIKLENGKSRIFCPISFRKYSDTNSVIGHYSKIYYSDDFGYTWQVSDTTTKELLPGYTEENTMTWAESKIIRCSDGTLRMYYTRNKLGCMQYTESKDEGVTWSGMYQMPEMQMPLNSYAVYEDTYEPGTYYMVCVIGTPKYLASMHPRTRNCLLRSTDGKNWEFLMNLERMNDYTSQLNGKELYQLLDPSLYISEDYIHITFGRSAYEVSEDDAGAHQAQRVRYVRVEKDKLSARPWDASTIPDMSYPKTIEIEEMPQTTFGMSDLFVCEGTVKLTDFNGNVTYEEISENCTVYTDPNMFKLGKTTIQLCWKNGTDLSYEINIVPNYDVTWDIYGEGEVEPEAKRIMEGGSKTFTLQPEKGWKAGKVYVNDERVKVKDSQFTVSDVKEDQNITVYFRAKTIFDYVIFWVALILLIIVVVVLLKMNKIKLPSFIKRRFKKDEKGERACEKE